MKLVSIIIATYNAGFFLERCLNSIRSQKTEEVELIIVDGASQDNTKNIIESNSDIVDAFISEKDKGVYDAWNKGIHLSSGRWIMFVGSDDCLESQILIDYIKLLHEKDLSYIDYISARANYVNSSGKVLFEMGKPWSWPDFAHNMTVAHVASLHARHLFKEIGEFDTQYRICADYELLLRKKASLKAFFWPKVVVNMQMGGISFSKDAVRETNKILSKYTEKNPISFKIESFLRYITFYYAEIKIKVLSRKS